MAASLESSDGDLGFQVAPMVDVVFVLMLFFMAAVGAQIIAKELPVYLPAHGRGDTTVAIVDITADGSVRLNEEHLGSAQDVQLPRVRARFRHIIEQFGDKDAVLIRPHQNVRHQRVMEVLDAVQSAGVAR